MVKLVSFSSRDKRELSAVNVVVLFCFVFCFCFFSFAAMNYSYSMDIAQDFFSLIA